MKINFLYSSSSGNATVVESTSGNTKIQIDAGVSYKKLKEAYQKDLDINALFITHDHSDHIKNAGIVARKTNCEVYLPEPAYLNKKDLFDNCSFSYITGGNITEINELEVLAFSTRHDSPGSVGYTVFDKESKLKFGFLTDTGVITKVIKNALYDCDAFFIESDYDVEGLEKCEEYDEFLKERIKGAYGHLSNQESLEFIKTGSSDKLQWAALGHLSKHTNTPETLQKRIEEIVPTLKDKLIILTDAQTIEIKSYEHTNV